MTLAPGDTVYIPAGVPSRVVPDGEVVQLRLKAEPPASEAVAWYCAGCGALVHGRELDEATVQRGWWRAVAEFNADAALRTCGGCGAVHAPAELGDIAWPAVADAIRGGRLTTTMRVVVLAEIAVTERVARALVPAGGAVVHAATADAARAVGDAALVVVDWDALGDGAAPLVRALADGAAPLVVLARELDAEMLAVAWAAGARDALRLPGDEARLVAHATRAAAAHGRGAGGAELRSLADYRSVIEHMPDGIFTYRLDHEATIIVWANPAIATLLGYASPAELVGTDARRFVAPEDRELIAARIRAVRRPPYSTTPATLRYLARDGSSRWVETRSLRVTLDATDFVTVIVRDLTARRSAEEALRRSEERFAKFFHVNPASSTVTRLSDDTFVDVNERFCELTGFARDEVIGRTGVSLGLWPDPRQRARIDEAVRRTGRAHDVEVRLRKKSGEPIDVRLSLEHFTVDGVECVFALSTDVTEQKRLEEQLRQSQKMEAIGRLAGGIAHDFNNLLTAINGYAEILTAELGEGSRAHDAAAHIQRSARRAASLTEQLLVFTRRRPQHERVVALNDVVQATSSMLGRLIGEDVELVLELGADAGHVRADPAQLEQVLLNLVVNARDAMPEGGRLVIETAAADGADGRPGARLSASDTGCGIDPAVRPHIFEPFFTTKEVGKGTGLGLSIVYGVVMQAGGTITVDSAVGRGATFVIWLPRAAAPAADAPPARAAAAPASPGGETILVVEDDDDVRDFVQFVLRQAGYRVLAASDGSRGLQLAEAHDGEIHLLLSDIVMPGMSGSEVAARAQALRPAMKVLHMSGYPGGRLMQHVGLAPGATFLQKPFSVETLTQAVRALLDR